MTDINNYTAKLRFLLLLIVTAYWFWPEIQSLVRTYISSSEASHGLALPLTISCFLFIKRRNFSSNYKPEPSFYGLLFILFGVIIYCMAIWPFTFGYLKLISLLPVLLGILICVYGPKVIRTGLILMLFILLALPIGPRLYASMTVKLESYTIAASCVAIDCLPKTDAAVKGVDIIVDFPKTTYIIGLGESRRGSGLLFSFATIGVFVTFTERITKLRLFFNAVIAFPIIMLSNLIRLISWAFVTISFAYSPESNVPRCVSAVVALFFSYVIFLTVNRIKLRLFIESGD